MYVTFKTQGKNLVQCVCCTGRDTKVPPSLFRACVTSSAQEQWTQLKAQNINCQILFQENLIYSPSILFFQFKKSNFFSNKTLFSTLFIKAKYISLQICLYKLLGFFLETNTHIFC